MRDYLRLRLRQALRSVAGGVPGRAMAFTVAGLAAVVGVQLLVLGDAADSPLGLGTPPPGRLQAEVGYAVLLLAALSLATGPQSSRFPSTPADVTWVYATPLSVAQIVATQFVWQAGRRCAFWIAGGGMLDVVGTAVLDTEPGLFVTRALLAVPLLVALVALSVGSGSTRGSPWPARTAVGLGLGLAVALLAPLAFELATGSAAGEAIDGAALSGVARATGAILFGRYDLAAAAVVGAMGLVGGGLCRAGGARLWEQLTLDAAFWAEFTMTSMRPVVEPKAPLRQLSKLTGPWALLWFEIAVLRRANYQRWSLLVLVVSALLTGAFAPEFVPVFAFTAPFGAVTGAYVSGVARHLRLGTLILVPGAMSARVVAAEAVHAGLSLLGLVLGLAVGSAVSDYEAGQVASLLLVGTVLLVIAVAIRVTTSALTYDAGTLPGGPFHVVLALLTVAGAGAAAALSWLWSKVDAPPGAVIASLLVLGGVAVAAALALFERRIGPSPADHASPLARPEAAVR